MPDGLDNLRQEFELFRQRVQHEAALGVSAAMQTVEAAAKATTAYQDQTGANRAGTIGYVVSGDGSLDESSRFDDALAAVEDKNPGHSLALAGPDPGPTEVLAILSGGTDYAIHVETGGAGGHASIGPTMDELAPRLHQGAEAGIRRVVG